MKQPEYSEGPEALKNFEEGMKAGGPSFRVLCERVGIPRH